MAWPMSLHVGEARQPRAEALDRLELGRPGGHPAEGPRRADGDRRRRRRAPRRRRGPPRASGAGGRGRGRAMPWSSWPSTSGASEQACRRPPGRRRPGAGWTTAAASGPSSTDRPARRDVALPGAGLLQLAGDGRGTPSEKPMPPGDETRPSASRRIDGHAVGAEQHAGVIAEVADDVADVEPRGQVGGDAAQRLGAAEPARRPARSPPAPRTRTPSVRAIAVARRRPSSGPSCTAPASTSTPHGASPPGIRDDQLVGAQAQRRGAGPRCPGGRGWAPATRARGRRRCAPGGTLRDAPRPAALDVGRARDEAARSPLPDPDERGPGGGADPAARLVEGGVEAAGERRDLGEVREQVDARRASRSERGRRRAPCARTRARRAGVAAPGLTPRRTRPRPGTAGGRSGGSAGRRGR